MARVMRSRWTLVLVSFALGIVIGVAFSYPGGDLPRNTRSAYAAGGVVESPIEPATDRYVYYPGTEELRRGEIRVICCGSGMPAARHGQAACSWLMECGNGEKLIFTLQHRRLAKS